MKNQTLKKIHKIFNYIFHQKRYYKNIEVQGQFADFTARLVVDRMGINCEKGKIACFNTNSIPTILHYHRAPIKLYCTQENTHVPYSTWHQFENIWEKEPSLSLTLGFDYVKHPRYLRFPYWIEHIFGPMATKESIAEFVAKYNYSDTANRTKQCAFVCHYDYFGDRAVLADLVAQIMPINYPSNFRHNDDDMRGKYEDDKIAYLQQFRFNLCPENSNNKGYVTEKIFDAIKAGCVPIYWGNEGYPEPDILNPRAIVCLDKDNQEEGYALLQRLYYDSKAYAEFASQPRFLPDAGERIYGYYEQIVERLREVLSSIK